MSRLLRHTQYNTQNIMMKGSLVMHYVNANKRAADGERIPPHDITLDPKGYPYVDGEVINEVPKYKQQQIFFQPITRTKSVAHTRGLNTDESESEEDIDMKQESVSLSSSKRSAARKSLKHIEYNESDKKWKVTKWEPSHLVNAEMRFKLLGCEQLNALINIHNRSYKAKYAVKKTAIPQLMSVKAAFLKLTIRGRINHSYIEFKKLLKRRHRNKPIFYLFHWEFIRLLFTQIYKIIEVTECLYIWKRCLVMDCPEPSNEGSVSILDNLMKGSILDSQLFDTFIIKCMFEEFTSKHNDLVECAPITCLCQQQICTLTNSR